jgi:uncharacterized membrane protein
MGLEIGGGITIGSGIVITLIPPDLANYICTELDQHLLTEDSNNLVTES